MEERARLLSSQAVTPAIAPKLFAKIVQASRAGGPRAGCGGVTANTVGGWLGSQCAVARTT